MTARIERKWFQKGTGTIPPEALDGFFIRELQHQCEFGLRAFGEMQQAYTGDKRHPTILALAHVLLVFAGNASKILGAPPSKSPKARARAARLRAALSLQDVKFDDIARARNYFEHFDERMERYIGNHGDGLLMQRGVEDHLPETVQLDDGRTFRPAFLQFLNTATLELILYDEKFVLKDILATLQRIQLAAKQWEEAKSGRAD